MRFEVLAAFNMARDSNCSLLPSLFNYTLSIETAYSPYWMWSSRWNESSQRKPWYSEETRPIATLRITNTTWPDLGSNPGRRCWKPASNRLSYDTAWRVLAIVYDIQGYWDSGLSSSLNILLPPPWHLITATYLVYATLCSFRLLDFI
jgi:hypothetical protein